MKLAIVLTAMTLGACAQRVANPCPDSQDTHCITNVVCAPDSARGCQMCRCETPYEVPMSQPPQGPPQPLPP